MTSAVAQKLLPMFISLLQKLDEDSLGPLKGHVNKTVCFDIENIMCLYLKITDNNIIVIDKPEHVDTTFTGPLSAFMSTLFGKQRTQTGLHIKGDMDCAKAFYDCTQQLDIDWENVVAKGLGDNMAHVIVSGIKETNKWMLETLRHAAKISPFICKMKKNCYPHAQKLTLFSKKSMAFVMMWHALKPPYLILHKPSKNKDRI